jgi:hypothetical protein
MLNDRAAESLTVNRNHRENLHHIFNHVGVDRESTPGARSSK